MPEPEPLSLKSIYRVEIHKGHNPDFCLHMSSF
jgi:hypothetical protein